MNALSLNANRTYLEMTNNKVVIENDCDFNNNDIAGAYTADDITGSNMNVYSNTVTITKGTNINDVYGGRVYNGTVS